MKVPVITMGDLDPSVLNRLVTIAANTDGEEVELLGVYGLGNVDIKADLTPDELALCRDIVRREWAEYRWDLEVKHRYVPRDLWGKPQGWVANV